MLRRPVSPVLGGAALVVYAALCLWRQSVRPFPAGLPWIYLVLSVLLFVVYAVDKSAARHGRWRVSERNLLLIGLLGGWPGAIVAQQLLRHKTRKASFQAWFWVTVVANAVIVLVLVAA